MSYSWRNTKGGIECCYKCVPPKRHPGCHDKCSEYKEAKEKYERKKQLEKENMARTPKINEHDFNKVVYLGHERHKR